MREIKSRLMIFVRSDVVQSCHILYRTPKTKTQKGDMLKWRKKQKVTRSKW